MYFEDAKNIKKNIDHQNFMIDNGSALSPAYFFLYYGFTIIIKFGTQVSRKILNLCDNIKSAHMLKYNYKYGINCDYNFYMHFFFVYIIIFECIPSPDIKKFDLFFIKLKLFSLLG